MPDSTMIESSLVRSSAVNISPNPKEESHPRSTPFPTFSKSTPPLRKSEDPREEIEEEGAIVVFEQPAQDDVTGTPNNEPDPSVENPEDANDLVYASFIRARTKPVVTSDPPPKRLTTQLQQKEALEFALKKSKRSRRRRSLVKDGKVVQEEDVPVVSVDEETKEEPSSLSRKSSRKKHSLSQSEKHTSKGAESSSKSDVAGSSKKLAKCSSDKKVKKRGDKSNEEEVEKSGEHRQSKSMEKGKFVGKSVKRKRDDDDKKPGSVKKEKVSETLRSEKRKLGNQKVVTYRVFVH
ncbi:uncharacterized protein [Nicotiana sylvestris]|uniref:uncharacterized protein n=1 Tax=Nicotiana sylvestris TaxID=4096 RepID=UPI00388C8FA5